MSFFFYCSINLLIFKLVCLVGLVADRCMIKPGPRALHSNVALQQPDAFDIPPNVLKLLGLNITSLYRSLRIRSNNSSG